jgi:hypothetical protein
MVKGENLEDQNRVSVIAVGESGTRFSLNGIDYEAPINAAYNSLIVGEEDSWTASSTKELEDVVSEIIDGQYVTEETTKYNGFRKFAILLGGAAALLTTARFAMESVPDRRKYKEGEL